VAVPGGRVVEAARPAGDRVKTARDAFHLARLLRLHEVVPVRIPTQAEEAGRDLVRAREASRQDLMRTRHRLSKLLLRYGIVYSGGRAELHDRQHRQRFDSMPTQAAFDDAYETVVLATARRTRLDEKITALAADSEFTPESVIATCARSGTTTDPRRRKSLGPCSAEYVGSPLATTRLNATPFETPGRSPPSRGRYQLP
jgi:transposase